MSIRSRLWSTTALVLYIALATVIVHALVGNRYGFHTDELATLEDARHLAWGYPAYPPVTPFFGRISLILFGTSLTGFRFFASLANAIAVVLGALLAKEMGGGRFAQLFTAAACVPNCLGAAIMMQYVSFDYLAWVLTAYCVVRLLRTENPRWWLAIGGSIGFGMLSKYTMGFFVLAIVAGLLLTDARRYLLSKWLWLGAALAMLMFLPNLLWEAQRGFVSLEFLRHIHARDVAMGRADGFLLAQLTMTAQVVAAAGLYYYFSRHGRRFRMIGWMYVTVLVLFLVARGRHYYLFPAYPMLYAGGAVWAGKWAGAGTRRIAWAVMALAIAGTAALFLPIAPVNTAWWRVADAVEGNYRSEFGWPELVSEVARVRNTLPAEERAQLGILAANYGEAGAVNLYGPRYGLPNAISGINSMWERGYGDPAPRTLIVVGLSAEFLTREFESCRAAGHTWNREGVENGEIAPVIFVCGAPREGWPTFWKHFRYFG